MEKQSKRVYMDHAATTCLDKRVKEAMEPYWINKFGNPSALYKEGREARKAIETARQDIAKTIGARAEEIIFTNGGTESDNLAIFGVAYNIAGAAGFDCPNSSRLNPRAGSGIGKLTSLRTGITGNPSEAKLSDSRPHIITTKFEHHAVLEPCKILEKRGFDVTYLEVGEDGIVDPKDVEKALRPETFLVSIMYANNEVGTIQPIAEIAKIIRNFRSTKHEARSTKQIQNSKLKNSKVSDFGFRISDLAAYPLLHTDACQAPEYLDLNVEKLGVDLMAVNGSKMYGPKGVGFLYAKRGIKLSPIIYGGSQERGLRPGTENVPAIMGLAEALKISQESREEESKRLQELRDYFINRILKEIPKTFLNGHPAERLPNNINVSILEVEGEAMLLYLDEYGIACSTGSACTAERFEPSHVVMALGKPHAYAHGSIRFTLGRETAQKDIDYVMGKLKEVVEKLRSISAVN